MTSTAVPKQAKLDELIKRLSAIRLALAESESAFETRVDCIDPSYLKSARNLAHYIALRHYDVRPLQEELAELGLSSLGRAEAHVMATLDAVLTAVHGLAVEPGNICLAHSIFRRAIGCCVSIPRYCSGPARPTVRYGLW